MVLCLEVSSNRQESDLGTILQINFEMPPVNEGYMYVFVGVVKPALPTYVGSLPASMYSGSPG